MKILDSLTILDMVTAEPDGWDQGTLTGYNPPCPPPSLTRHVHSSSFAFQEPLPVSVPTTLLPLLYLYNFNWSSPWQSCFPKFTHHNLNRDWSTLPIAPLPKTQVICFYVTSRHLPFFPLWSKFSYLKFRDERYSVYQRGSLTTCSVLRGCCGHLAFFLIPQKPCRSLQRNEYRRWSAQSLIWCLGGTSCHRVLLSSCSSSVFQNWQSAFTHVRTFHPSNNWDLGGDVKKLRPVMFQMCRIKASVWTDLLIPNPEFFYDAFLSGVLATLRKNIFYPSLP